MILNIISYNEGEPSGAIRNNNQDQLLTFEDYEEFWSFILNFNSKLRKYLLAS